MTTTLLDNRAETIAKIKGASDIKFPTIEYWNYGACEHHIAVGPQADCAWQLCGGDLFSHQRVTATWLLTAKKGLLASVPGTGKTNSALAAICILKSRGMLPNRAVLIPQTPALGQWANEAKRFAPGLRIIAVDGTIVKKQRLALYATDWDLAIIGSHVSISDADNLTKMGPFTFVATDDVDPILNHDNATHRAIEKIARRATYAFTINATALQTRLEQLHAALVPAGGHDVFGAKTNFESRYLDTRWAPEYDSSGRVTRTVKKTIYRRQEEFKKKFEPLYLRHTLDDIDISMPELMPPTTEWVDLSPAVRERYEELQDGVMRLIKEEGTKIKQVTALSKFTYGQMLCAGLPALNEPDGPGASPKLDKFFRLKTTAWQDDKVVVFMKNTGMVKAAANRAREYGIDFSIVWGGQGKETRNEQIVKFRTNDNCQLLFGTTSIERSLNLQVARIVSAIDTQLNPARVQQLIGRVQRAGSPHDRIYVFNFLTNNTIEERFMEILLRRQALYDNVFGEENKMFGALSPLELLMMFRRD